MTPMSNIWAVCAAVACHHEKSQQLWRETGQLCPDNSSNYPQAPGADLYDGRIGSD